MAQSPIEAGNSDDIDAYLDNWDALSSMLTRGRSFSGFERHCSFLNLGAKSAGETAASFANVSAATGLDLIDDGRAVARVDWDRDGDLDFWVTSRTAPRLRFLQNMRPASRATDFVSFTLEGTSCNRDAIGAVLQLKIGERTLTRALRAGEGFMGQSSKRVHFGLGNVSSDQKGVLTVRWPIGEPQFYPGIEPGRHYHLVQSEPEATAKTPPALELEPGSFEAPPATEKARIILTERVPAPLLEYVDFSGKIQRYDPETTGGRATLINLWASWCAPCLGELRDFAEHAEQFASNGLRIVALTTEGVVADGAQATLQPAKALVRKSRFPFDMGAASADGLRLLTILHNQIVVRERPLPLPTSFLIDKYGNLAAIYKGPVSAEQLLDDLALLEAPRAEVARAAFPFPSRDGLELFSATDLAFAKAYEEGGYLVDAKREARRAIEAASTGNQALDANNRVRAWYYLGTLEQATEDWEAAAQAYGKALELSPGNSMMQIARGVVLWQSGEQETAERSFAEAAARAPENGQILEALAKAHLQIERPDQAVAYVRKALDRKPGDLQLSLLLGLAHEEAGEPAQALAVYRQIANTSPQPALANNHIARLLATSEDPAVRDPAAALALASEVNQLTNHRNPTLLGTLAAAQAANGDPAAAIKTVDQAVSLARAIGRDALVAKLREEKEQYLAQLSKAPSS